jgi:hypothetical protein
VECVTGLQYEILADSGVRMYKSCRIILQAAAITQLPARKIGVVQRGIPKLFKASNFYNKSKVGIPRLQFVFSIEKQNMGF